MPIYKDKGKKDGLQKYRVRVNYTDSYGKAKQMTRIAYGLEEAKMLEMRLLRQQGESTKAFTIGELYQEYISAKKIDVRETSLDKTIRVINRHVMPSFQETRLDKLSAPMLQKWKEEISAKGLALITRQNIFGEFRALLNYAVKMQYIPKNPLATLGNFRDAYFEPKQEKIKYYTAEQFQRFIAQAYAEATETGNFGYFVFFSIAFFTGMRKGEINALRWSDIEGDIIHVRRSVAQKIKGNSVIETPPKNKSSYRDIQIPAPLMEILVDHKNRHQKDTRFTEEFRVCGGIKCLGDTPISNKGFQYADEAGLPHIRIHDFRHSHVSLLANEGINIQEIARRLGHSKIDMTWNTYAHLYPREEERALTVLNGISVHELYTKNLKTE